MGGLQPACPLPSWLVTWGEQVPPASVSLCALRRSEPAASAEEAGCGWPGETILPLLAEDEAATWWSSWGTAGPACPASCCFLGRRRVGEVGRADGGWPGCGCCLGPRGLGGSVPLSVSVSQSLRLHVGLCPSPGQAGAPGLTCAILGQVVPWAPVWQGGREAADAEGASGQLPGSGESEQTWGLRAVSAHTAAGQGGPPGTRHPCHDTLPGRRQWPGLGGDPGEGAPPAAHCRPHSQMGSTMWEVARGLTPWEIWWNATGRTLWWRGRGP